MLKTIRNSEHSSHCNHSANSKSVAECQFRMIFGAFLIEFSWKATCENQSWHEICENGATHRGNTTGPKQDARENQHSTSNQHGWHYSRHFFECRWLEAQNWSAWNSSDCHVERTSFSDCGPVRAIIQTHALKKVHNRHKFVKANHWNHGACRSLWVHLQRSARTLNGNGSTMQCNYSVSAMDLANMQYLQLQKMTQ